MTWERKRFGGAGRERRDVSDRRGIGRDLGVQGMAIRCGRYIVGGSGLEIWKGNGFGVQKEATELWEGRKVLVNG